MPLTDLQKEREERRMTTVLYIGSVVVMLVLLYATYMNISQYKTSVAEVRSLNRARFELESVLSSLRDAETGVRGYQLTADTSFLEPYRNANRRLYDQTARLEMYAEGVVDEVKVIELRRLTDKLHGAWRTMA